MRTPRAVLAAMLAVGLTAAGSGRAWSQSADRPRETRAQPPATASAGADTPATARKTATDGSARAELEDLRVTLEAAVGRTRRVGMVAGGAAGRTYRLKDYGAVIVLAPRPLPARRMVVRHVPTPVPSARFVIRAPEDAFDGVVVDLSAFQRELEEQMAAQAESLREMESIQRAWTRARDEQVQSYVRQVEEQAEAFRAEAERARQQAERQVRTRLAPPAPAPAPPAPSAAAPPVPPPAAVPAPVAVAPVVVAQPPQPPAPPEAPDAMDPFDTPPPPWRFWFEGGGEDEMTVGEAAGAADVETLVSAVRESVASGLESYRRPLASLRAEEFVAVAVDFVPDRPLRARPARTLLVRVRARDLRERQAGRLSATEFRSRLEFEEN
jgi:hypothetical protein